MNFSFRDLFARREPARASEEKASRTGAMVALFSGNRPRWTPRDYQALAREGYAKNPIAFRSVRMIAEAAANVPLLLYEGAREHDEHPLLALLSRPNPRQTGADLIEQLAGYLLVSGNAYLERVSVLDEVRELHALRPDRMKVIPGAEGWAEAYEYRVGGSAVRFAMSEAPAPILHLTLFNPLDDHYGMSPLEAAQASLDVHNAASAWNKALLDNAARPSGALVYSAAGGNLSDEQFERLKSELEAHYQGAANAGRPLLLEGGLDWKGLSLSPKDMDFVEAKHIAAREIALSFGVPPMLLGIPGDNTYSNYAEANRAFYRQTVVPLISRIASALGNWLGESFGESLRLAPDLDEVPALSIEREALWKRVGDASFLTDDEKRAAAGYEPLPVSSFAPLAKYDPNQPRVPAGNSDGGQWTAGGYAGSAANADEGRVLSDASDDEVLLGEQYAQLNPPRGPRGWLVHRLPNGQFVVVPPPQAARLQAAQNQADALTREVRERDPNWQPHAVVTSMTVQGEIARYEARAEQARSRLEEIRLGIGGNFSPPLNPSYSPATSYIPTQSFNGPALLNLYRQVYREPDLWGRDNFDNNTVAVTNFNGSTVYGVNSEASTYYSEDFRLATTVRDRLLATYPDKLNTQNIGQWPNNSLFHAESTILLRAARANGGSLEGMTIEVHLDRTVCPSCLAVLPLLTRELGSPTVIYRSTKTDQPLIIRNGIWVK